MCYIVIAKVITIVVCHFCHWKTSLNTLDHLRASINALPTLHRNDYAVLH